MKKIILTTLIAALSLSLQARENPFAKYEEETGRMYELNENPTTPEEVQEAMYIKKVQDEINGKLKETESKPAVEKQTKPAEKVYTKKELDSIIEKTKQQNEKKTKEIVKKELANVKKEPEQVIFVKPRADISDGEKSSQTQSSSALKSILPFLKYEIVDDKLIIYSEHKMFKKFSIDKENKLAFDYKAKVNFKTKREQVNSKDFKNIALGNHQKDGYFRVAVELVNKPSKYNIEVSEGSVTITPK